MSRKVVIAVVAGVVALVAAGVVVLAPALMGDSFEASFMKSFDEGCRRSARQALVKAGGGGAALERSIDSWCTCALDVVRPMSRAEKMALNTPGEAQGKLAVEVQRRCTK